MFSVGDRVVIQDCSVNRWLGMTGVVVDPNYGGGGKLTNIRLDVPFEDDILGFLTTMGLHHHRYKLVQPKEPDWEV
jgi:hypothetical protein